ncbi:ecdysone 20-monooxygenase isoform X1 [Cimex lectularius]|uniref:Cytochrome P450 n=1 Tax=Cimex lectularius TaxID=79782 RepID=A0A8I6RTE6_CIMLE|nr:ecdysone 20-monooxygenase isoform X1 [Cimex lectularius]
MNALQLVYHNLRMYDLPDWGVLDFGAVAIFVLLIWLTELRWHKSKFCGVRTTKPLTIKDVPGPKALPIIGTRWIYYGKFKLTKIHEAYQELFKRYGRIVREEAIWNYPVISIMDGADIEKVLRHVSRYPMRPPTEVIAFYRASRPDRYTNLGIINEQGESWQKLRSLLTPELTSARTMNRFFPELNSVADDFNQLLLHSREEGTGLIKGFDELACRMGLESTCTLILGKRLGFLDADVSPLAKKLAEAVKDQFCASRDTFFGLPFWKIFPTPAYKKFMSSEDTIYDIISEMVENAEKLEQDTCDIDAMRSVFMAILKAEGLDLRDKKAGIIDFIAAGIKTLGNTLVFLLYLIAKNKHCQEKLYEEVNQLAPNGSALDLHTLKEAHYLRACIMEAFRILPTAPCVARILETDMELSGYHLQPGSVVLCHTWLACLEESNFKNAKTFMPERWLGKDSSCSGHSHPFLVVPFGVGRRMCPGKRFVELELQVVLAQTVRQFEIEFDGELRLEFEFLLAPKSPANFRLKERQ